MKWISQQFKISVKMFLFQWIQYSNIFICFKYAGNWWGIQNACSCAQGKGRLRLMCTYTLALSLFMFLAAFLSYIVCFICRDLSFTFIQKRCVGQKRLFFSSKTKNLHEISFFYLKFFLRTKVSQNPFNFNQIES